MERETIVDFVFLCFAVAFLFYCFAFVKSQPKYTLVNNTIIYQYVYVSNGVEYNLTYSFVISGSYTCYYRINNDTSLFVRIPKYDALINATDPFKPYC